MPLNTMHDLLIEELKDLYSAETQILKALPKMAKGASTGVLTLAFEAHLEQTHGHVVRLEQMFDELGASPRGKRCKGMEGLLAEGAEALDEEGADLVRDAALIAGAQRVEHYEIAAYGSALACAKVMQLDEIAGLLEETLAEERAADRLLSSIGEERVNPRAPLSDDAAPVEH
jgi:ferritin-like metal-binding protein YciE